MAKSELTSAIKTEARRLGFELSGVCPAVAPAGAISRLRDWLDRGFQGEMSYFEDRLEAYGDPNKVLDGVRSVVVLGTHYRTEPAKECPPGYGRISRYAWGDSDYHDLIHARLKQFCAFVELAAPGSKNRGVVDTAPVLEREFARLAGLGWIGKNTLTLNRDTGSYFFLSALLTDLALVYDAPSEVDHCGTCTACLDACPTKAFPQPYVLDARRCLSYLTIELRGPIPHEFRENSNEWLFGCDVCQEVCPWNRKAPISEEPGFQPKEDANPVELRALFRLSEEAFRARFRETPLWRSKRRGILRNAAIVLGAQRHAPALPELTMGASDADPIIREACAWAVRQIREP